MSLIARMHAAAGRIGRTGPCTCRDCQTPPPFLRKRRPDYLTLVLAVLVVGALAVAIVFGTGCEQVTVDPAPSTPPPSWVPPDQATRDAYAAEVWSDMWHMKLAGTGVTSIQQPTWTWIEGADLDCANGTGWLESNGGCYDGSFFPAPQYGGDIALAYGGTLTQTAMVHENCHAVQYFQNGDGDPNHTGICFVPGGWVDQETAKLKEEGW